MNIEAFHPMWKTYRLHTLCKYHLSSKYRYLPKRKRESWEKDQSKLLRIINQAEENLNLGRNNSRFLDNSWKFYFQCLKKYCWEE